MRQVILSFRLPLPFCTATATRGHGAASQTARIFAHARFLGNSRKPSLVNLLSAHKQDFVS